MGGDITEELLSRVSLSTLHPLELARQVAILDHSLYRAIRPSELLHMRWTKKDKLIQAPHVLASIRQFCE